MKNDVCKNTGVKTDWILTDFCDSPKQRDTFEEIRCYLDTIPVISAHEHYAGYGEIAGDFNVFTLLPVTGAVRAAAMDGIENAAAVFEDTKRSFHARFKFWQKYFFETQHTAAAKVLIAGLKSCWGIRDFTEKSLLVLQETMRTERNQKFYHATYEKHKIVCIISHCHDFAEYLDGQKPYSRKFCRFVFPISLYCQANGRLGGADALSAYDDGIGRRISCLDDYLEMIDVRIKRAVKFGIVGLKMVNRYLPLDYRPVSRGEAEQAFNTLIALPLYTPSSPEVRWIVEDFIIHHFLRLAQRYHLPVQIHTGRGAGFRGSGFKNEIIEGDPAHLHYLLRIYQDVSFDIFHGGYPHTGNFLCTVQTFPNAFMNLCWLPVLDPLAAVDLMERAIMTVPHAKITAFGGDAGTPEYQVGNLLLTKDVVSLALTDLVAKGWLGVAEAKALAYDMLFNNPNRLFKLNVIAA